MDGVDETHTRADAAAAVSRARSRRRRTLGFDLAAIAGIGLLLAAAFGATAAVLYDELYSPEAFVSDYLELLADGNAADALTVPGVAISSASADSADMESATEALLRQSALAPLSDIEVVGSLQRGAVTEVTMAYSAGPHHGRSTFDVVRDGSIGLAPTWRFSTSPLAVIDLTVHGAMQFDVNGFEIDKRQVSADGANADPEAAIPMLVFSPGLYSISVATPTAVSSGVAVLSDKPLAQIPVTVQTTPTDEFVQVVQENVDDFLDACATQEVLQPTGCPFGLTVQNRIVSTPEWSITEDPTITLEPDGANWTIPKTDAVAHIDVDIQSIYDGSIRHLDEDVPFSLGGTVTMLPDGTASISVDSAD